MMTTSDGFECLPGEVKHSVAVCLNELGALRFSERLESHDVTLWPGNREESRQRLGWLRAPQTMTPFSQPLQSFAETCRQEGFSDVVLLGMGGSSLGAEVVNQVIGRARGFPRLHVLDSTVPAVIDAVTREIDLKHSLFIVASKSGSTLEPTALYEYYFHEIQQVEGQRMGAHFVAITDPGSSLEQTALQRSFRKVFQNPTDIGGRYSVLSLFGLVPASLLGLNPPRLLAHAEQMARRCRPGIPPHDNPGAHLGAFISGCARLGRNKLTLLTSPRLASFGLWAEQLLAESTGKEGQGIVPVTAEPTLGIEDYGADRAFAYLRLEGDANEEADSTVLRLRRAEFPCVTLNMDEPYSLAAEFYRWEYATAVAGTLLGMNPFDQPDVQRAKDASTRVLSYYEQNGGLPPVDAISLLTPLLESLRPRDYFATLAYLRQRPEIDSVFAALRREIATTYRVSTTLGYGPRYLHSTGQLHKGGPDECVLLQVVSRHESDMPVPGRGYSFGTIADAQALGDLQALQGLNRRVGRIQLERDDAGVLAQALGLS